jgi:membrane protein YdbS with pleckstrin-like domain
MMHAMILRPSVKLVMTAYVLCILLAIAAGIYWYAAADEPPLRREVPLAVPALLLLWTAIRHLKRRTSKLTISAGRIRYESGILSKTSRVMELAKVQDVRVDQSLGQRILNVGDLSLETAGETSRITMPPIDRPQEAADHILEMSRAQRSGQPAAPSITQTLTQPFAQAPPGPGSPVADETQK